MGCAGPTVRCRSLWLAVGLFGMACDSAGDARWGETGGDQPEGQPAEQGDAGPARRRIVDAATPEHLAEICDPMCRFEAAYLCVRSPAEICQHCTEDSQCQKNPESRGPLCNTERRVCGCKRDRDCAGFLVGFRCDTVNRWCGCQNDDDCARDRECVRNGVFGRCRLPCRTRYDCEQAEECDPNNRCIDALNQ